MEQKYNPLIFGKDQTENIVSIEVTDDKCELFIQNNNGDVESKIVRNKFWMLANTQLDKNFVKLKGEQHYRYGRQFTKFSDYSKFRTIYADKVFGVWDKKESIMLKDGYTYFKGLKVKDVSVLAFDIETTGKDETYDVKCLLISNTFRDSKGIIKKRLFCFDEYENQGLMIKDWCDWVKTLNPSIIAGHNIYGFDLPMLKHIGSMNNVTLSLGRDNSDLFFSNKESRFRKDGSQTIGYKRVRCYGRELIDTMFLAIKYDVARNFESYALKQIIKDIGKEKKDRQHYDASQIRYTYQNPDEWKKIKAYAIDDADDVITLYDLMIPSFFYYTMSVPKSFQSVIESATGSQLNSMLIRSYLQDAHSIPKADEITEHVQGGISFAIPGVYRNMAKVDLKAAYPSQIRRFKLFNPTKDPEGNFLKITEYFTLERLENKKIAKETGDQYYVDLEQAAKIVINSMYGLTITNGLNFNSPDLGAKITKETRDVIDLALKWASGKDKDYWISKFEETK